MFGFAFLGYLAHHDKNNQSIRVDPTTDQESKTVLDQSNGFFYSI